MSFQSTKSAPICGGALVSKTGAGSAERSEYLQLAPDGAALWVHDPASATAFASMRDAARMALRLPARLRAYGLPRDIEVRLAN